MPETRKFALLATNQFDQEDEYIDSVLHSINNRIASVQIQLQLLSRENAAAVERSQMIWENMDELHLLVEGLHILAKKQSKR